MELVVITSCQRSCIRSQYK